MFLVMYTFSVCIYYIHTENVENYMYNKKVLNITITEIRKRETNVEQKCTRNIYKKNYSKSCHCYIKRNRKFEIMMEKNAANVIPVRFKMAK